jgi:hypothetical protein
MRGQFNTVRENADNFDKKHKLNRTESTVTLLGGSFLLSLNVSTP